MRRLTTPAKFAALAVLLFVNSTLAQTDSIYRLPAGTKISLKLDAELSSKVSSVNDTFLAYVAKPVLNRETVVIPTDTVIEGRVTNVSRAAGGGRTGRLDVVFESIKFEAATRRIDAVLTSPIRPEPAGPFRVLSVLGGAAAGALVGAASSTTGALIGAGVGAGAGAAIGFLRKGKDVRIKKGEEFEIELRKEVVLPVLDY